MRWKTQKTYTRAPARNTSALQVGVTNKVRCSSVVQPRRYTSRAFLFALLVPRFWRRVYLFFFFLRDARGRLRCLAGNDETILFVLEDYVPLVRLP